jgi:glycosyltransferase involved in cell wall biosynthesis
MKITAIVVTYNNPGALVVMIQGILKQHILPDEVIIADDGSAPDTAELIRRWMKGFPCRLVHVWQEHNGFRAAHIRNKAIRASTGDYLIFSDGDLIWHPDFIRDYREKIRENTAWIGSRVFLTEAASEKIIHTKKAPDRFCFMSRQISHNRINAVRVPFLYRMFPSISFSDKLRGGLLGVWKSDLMAVNGWNESFAGWGFEDTEVVARLYFSGVVIRKLKFSAITYHIWHPFSDRSALKENRKLLMECIDNRLSWCENGLVKRGNS